MKFKDIQEMTTDELLTRKRDLRQESLHLRLQQQSGQLEQPSRMRLLRRDVARVETVLTERNKAGWDERNNDHGRNDQPGSTSRASRSRHAQKLRVGQVLSSGMSKTIVVQTVNASAACDFRQDREAEKRKFSTRTMKRTKPKRATQCGSWRRGR